MEAELATLCRACGMCCDGSLFGRVPLEPDEVAASRRHGLRVLPSATAFEQPCSALTGDRTCAIYDERPRACRRFVCRLYERHRREGGAIAPRLALVARVRVLVAELEASGLTPEDLEDARADASMAEAYRELMRLLEEHFARAP